MVTQQIGTTNYLVYSFPLNFKTFFVPQNLTPCIIEIFAKTFL